MARNLDPTMEDMRREQALLRSAWAKQKEKPLSAITVALAGQEPRQTSNSYIHPMSKPEWGNTTIPYPAALQGYTSGYPAAKPKSQQPANTYVRPKHNPEFSLGQSSRQYGPYFNMEREYPITMAGLRQAEFQHDRNTKMKQALTSVGDVLEPIADFSLQATEALSKSEDAVQLAKIGGKALTVVGYIGDVADIAEAVRADLRDSDERLGKKTVAAIGGAASSAIFGYMGAAVGTALMVGAAGALSGSVIPGAGTAVGFIGGFIGGLIGAAAGEDFSDWVINQINWNE